VEDVAVKARVPALVQTATVDHMLVVLEVDQLVLRTSNAMVLRYK
jgi:hypothetical protein